MPVPNNYNFSLQDVVNEIPGGQSSLQECFNEANASSFDPLYQGSKNSLRNFRNYRAILPVTTYPINLGRGFNDQQSCTAPLGFYYITGGSELFEATGIYTNSSGTANAPASFYSDRNIVRYWTGSGFSGLSMFCLTGPPGGGIE